MKLHIKEETAKIRFLFFISRISGQIGAYIGDEIPKRGDVPL